MTISMLCTPTFAESIRDEFQLIPDVGLKIALKPSPSIQHLVVDERNDYIALDYYPDATSDMKMADIEENIGKYHYEFTAFKRSNGDKLYALSLYFSGVGDQYDKSSISFYLMAQGKLKPIDSHMILPDLTLTQFLAPNHSVPPKLTQAALTACKPSICALYLTRYTLPQKGTTLQVKAEPLSIDTPDNPSNWIESVYRNNGDAEGSYYELFKGSNSFELNWDRNQGNFKIGRKLSAQ